jgi:hypothetical protein
MVGGGEQNRIVGRATQAIEPRIFILVSTPFGASPLLKGDDRKEKEKMRCESSAGRDRDMQTNPRQKVGGRTGWRVGGFCRAG